MGSKAMLKVLHLACYAVLGNSLQLLNAGGGRGAGLLLPRALNERQQSQMYAYVCANARGTQEWQNLQLDAGTLACDERDMRVPASLNVLGACLTVRLHAGSRRHSLPNGHSRSWCTSTRTRSSRTARSRGQS